MSLFYVMQEFKFRAHMGKNALFLLFIIVFSLNISAQDTLSTKWGVHLNYFAESGYHHGAEIGMTYAFFDGIKSREKIKKSGLPKVKTRSHQLITGFEFGMYNHPNNKKTYMLNATIAHQFMLTRGFYTEIGAGLGYYRGSYNLPVYQFNEAEELIQLKRGGRSSFNSSLFFGWGYNMSNVRKVPLAYGLRFSLMYQTPYNNHFVLLPAWEFRIAYFINKKKNNEK